jgi:hypothetical protein
MNIELDVQLVHAPGIVKNLDHKDVHGTLLSKPESQWITSQMELIQKTGEQNTRPERHQEPEDQNVPQELDGFFPVGLTA